MLRTVTSAAATATLAAAALAGFAGTAAADEQAPGPVSFYCDHCQIAGGDIFDAGRDNIVGSGDGTEFGEMTDLGVPPGVDVSGPSTVVRLVVGPGVFYPGLTLVSQEGSGDYPRDIPPNWNAFIPVSGASTAVYKSPGGLGDVTITVKAGDEQATCTSDGNLSCDFDPRSSDRPRPLLIDAR